MATVNENKACNVLAGINEKIRRHFKFCRQFKFCKQNRINLQARSPFCPAQYAWPRACMFQHTVPLSTHDRSMRTACMVPAFYCLYPMRRPLPDANYGIHVRACIWMRYRLVDRMRYRLVRMVTCMHVRSMTCLHASSYKLNYPCLTFKNLFEFSCS